MKLQEELKDSGFVLIASHAQSVPKDDVVGFLRSNKVNYSVTSFGSVPGDTGRGIPRAFLFDSSGKLVEAGHPMTLKSKVEELVASEPHWLASGREYTKIRPIADALKKTTSYGLILKKLSSEVRKGGEVAEEAEHLSERILGFGKQKVEQAKTLEGEDPYEAYTLYTTLSKDWKGSEIGDGASDRLKELKRDKEFQNELKASLVAHQILEQCEKLVAQDGKVNLEYSPNKKIAATVRAMVPMLKKRYPDSKAAAAISDELAGYGFKDL